MLQLGRYFLWFSWAVVVLQLGGFLCISWCFFLCASAGRLCNWVIARGEDSPEDHALFTSYRSTQSLQCHESGKAADLIVTPNDTWPDVLYYQVNTHFCACVVTVYFAFASRETSTHVFFLLVLAISELYTAQHGLEALHS